MLSEFKLGYNAAEATKNICCAKDKGELDHRAMNDREEWRERVRDIRATNATHVDHITVTTWL